MEMDTELMQENPIPVSREGEKRLVIIGY